jgi:hypothetical protein
VDFGTDGQKRATVKKRVTDYEGNLVGRKNKNPLLDTREYLLEYEDGTQEKMFANTIAENIYAQIDEEGQQYLILKEIIDHKASDDAITRADGFIIGQYGQRIPKRTTKGWKLCVEWRDGSTSWIQLKDLKESNPIEVAEYAIANRIGDEPAFSWWVPTVIRKRNRIIAKLQKKYWRTEYKFGIRVPKTVEEALEIDRATGTQHWEKALWKEMSKVKVAYKLMEGINPEDVRHGKVPQMIGFQEIKCHIIFDVKMDFTRKARFVAGGHLTQPATSSTYSSVVSRDSVRLAFLLASLNGLKVLSCDIGNAYLNAPCREKNMVSGRTRVWIRCG